MVFTADAMVAFGFLCRQQFDMRELECFGTDIVDHANRHTHTQAICANYRSTALVRSMLDADISTPIIRNEKNVCKYKKKMEEKKLYESIVELYTNVCMQIEEEKNQN